MADFPNAPTYLRTSSSYSYWFRPGRNAHQALCQCQQYITEGCGYAVDMDLEKFFDQVIHSKLIELISRTVKDGWVVCFKIIRYHLKTSLTIMNKGPHCDIINWKHYTSDWSELESSGTSSFKASSYSPQDAEGFGKFHSL